MNLKGVYRQGRLYAITLSRMSFRQIIWRVRRLLWQQVWKRQKPRWPSACSTEILAQQLPCFGHLSPLEPDGPVIKNADAICAGRFAFLNLSVCFEHIVPDWSISPDGDPLWTYMLHYFEYARDLLWAYRVTGASHYIQVLIQLINDWIELNPLWTPVAWNAYPLSRRLITWSILLGHLVDEPLFKEHCLQRMISSMRQQADFLFHNLEYDVDNNHLISNARALIMAGLCLGRDPQARSWQRQGLLLFEQEVEKQLLTDGGHCERSLSYQMVVLQDVLETIMFMQQSAMAVPGVLHEVVRQMYDYLGSFVSPDGRLPMLNDTVIGYPMNPVEMLSVGAVYLDQPGLKRFALGKSGTYLDWLLGAEGRQAFEAIPTSEPNIGSEAFSESGYYIMGSGQGQTACRLLFDCGPIGPSHSAAHAHADTLSFELMAFAQPLLIDPGVYEYKAGEWRNYFRSTAAHNTVTVDSQDQSVFWGSFRVGEMAQARLLYWETNEDCDVIEAEHDGYTRLKSSVRHRRSIRFTKPTWWIIEDTLESDGRASHLYQLHFHLAPSASLLSVTAEACRVHFPEGVIVDFSMKHPVGTRVKVDEGWISPSWKVKTAIPVLQYSLQTSARKVVFETTLVVSQM